MTVQGRLLPCDSARCLTHPCIGCMDWSSLTMKAESRREGKVQAAVHRQEAAHGQSPRSTEGSEVPLVFHEVPRQEYKCESKTHGPGGAEDKATLGWQGQRQALGHICPLDQRMG